MIVGTKQAEIDYPAKLDAKEQVWLTTKPFGDFNRAESRRTFQDFSTVLNLIQRHQPKAKRILELGCGPGWLGVFLGEMGFEVSGYDISPEMIEVAKKRAQNNQSVQFEVADIEETLIDAEINRNDVVIIYDALHHCQSDEKVIGKIFKYLKPGGILILAEPNRVHAHDQDSLEAVERFGVTERGLNAGQLRNLARRLGFGQTWRYHASGQSFEPRNEGLADTIKMLIFPLLVRLYYGRNRTRIWIVAKK
jgi:SAM-dependent methyltransferase